MDSVTFCCTYASASRPSRKSHNSGIGFFKSSKAESSSSSPFSIPLPEFNGRVLPKYHGGYMQGCDLSKATSLPKVRTAMLNAFLRHNELTENCQSILTPLPKCKLILSRVPGHFIPRRTDRQDSSRRRSINNAEGSSPQKEKR
jgi:hypothetical protein